jgi:hypothetical protein
VGGAIGEGVGRTAADSHGVCSSRPNVRVLNASVDGVLRRCLAVILPSPPLPEEKGGPRRCAHEWHSIAWGRISSESLTLPPGTNWYSLNRSSVIVESPVSKGTNVCGIAADARRRAAEPADRVPRHYRPVPAAQCHSVLPAKTLAESTPPALPSVNAFLSRPSLPVWLTAVRSALPICLAR